VIEHLASPESFVDDFIAAASRNQNLQFIVSTGNVAFIIVRLMLLAGQFNYGKRGILDLTHTRLFTISSFRKLLRDGGFAIDGLSAFGPPIQDMIGGSAVLRLADTASARFAHVWPRMFAFSFLVVARKADELRDVYERTLTRDRV